MRYGSVCSGIEAATMAWHPLGWSPSFFSEIEAFPSAVLSHHYPTVPNLGDMTKFEEWPDHAIDLLVGGTPCQSFSVAGLRQGLADPRGNLMLTYLAIARRYQPRWLVWENVPGVLSSNGGRDFGTFIRGLEECGYHAAWRVLDAQYVRVDGFERAVPQRRRRVFVVGYLGDWRRAAAVLFEPEGMRGDSAPSRKAGQRPSPTISSRPTGGGGLGTDFDLDGGLIPFGGNNTSGHIDGATAVNAHGGPAGRLDFESETFVAHSLRAEGFDASEDGTGRGTPIVPVASYPLTSGMSASAARMPHEQGCLVAHAIQERAVSENLENGPQGKGFQADVAYTIEARNKVQAVQKDWAVRRLTPRECERLQGFPDNFTNVPYRGKPAADGPRYKALGNSMAVNVMRWIGQRIQQVETITARAA
ncbi:DNA cytosine methyltransferase [Ensifer sp. PDNC004]|uniref:DNA cytosine methyltransferase n=1 Tax=Ensifer sp. PDNC004 TaxID=2811423 RepID=UPI0019636525|nr:DNA cytosine methyltransferase [Ensifer sp. PDNC004]QRY69218.1 DNA cytosine methyltransferase [Ensifer sp. PDNC004]